MVGPDFVGSIIMMAPSFLPWPFPKKIQDASQCILLGKDSTWLSDLRTHKLMEQ